MNPRKRRSDYGTIQTTERDMYLLAWIAGQYAIQLDQLKLLVEAHKGESVTHSAIKWLTNRWLRAGWVERKKLLAGRPQWVWLTRQGLTEMGLPYPYLRPGVGRLKHIYYANAVRFYVEQRRGAEAQWISDRQVNQERKARKKKHRVDGEVVLEGTRIAIEVELTPKSQKRLDSILRELRRDYQTVWYFVSENCYPVVRGRVVRLSGEKGPFVIYRLSDILGH